jgi:HEPN domain-containing protein
MPERFPPDDPREWLSRARSDLILAKAAGVGIYLEDLCFHAQQAAEKAVKALLIRQRVDFPYVHDLAELLTLLERTGLSLPESIRQSASSLDLPFSRGTPVLRHQLAKKNTKRL